MSPKPRLPHNPCSKPYTSLHGHMVVTIKETLSPINKESLKETSIYPSIYLSIYLSLYIYMCIYIYRYVYIDIDIRSRYGSLQEPRAFPMKLRGTQPVRSRTRPKT